MARKALSTPITNTTRKPTGTASTATIVHNASPGATDGYFCAAVDLSNFSCQFEVLGDNSAETQFWGGAYGPFTIITLRQSGLGTVTMKNAVIAAQPAVKVLYTGRYNRLASAVLVMNNAGGGDSSFQDNQGRIWPVQDIGAGATGLPQLKYSSGSGSFTVDTGMNASNIGLWNHSQDIDGIIISLTDTNSAAEPIHINTAATAAERLVQGSGGDITFTHVSPLGDPYYAPAGKNYLQLYLNETTLGLEHAGFAPLNVTVDIFPQNLTVPVTYNPNAASDGKLLRWSHSNHQVEANFTGAADLATKSSLALQPYQDINFS